MENAILTVYKLGHLHAFSTVHSSGHLPEKQEDEWTVEEVQKKSHKNTWKLVKAAWVTRPRIPHHRKEVRKLMEMCGASALGGGNQTGLDCSTRKLGFWFDISWSQKFLILSWKRALPSLSAACVSLLLFLSHPCSFLGWVDRAVLLIHSRNILIPSGFTCANLREGAWGRGVPLRESFELRGVYCCVSGRNREENAHGGVGGSNKRKYWQP